MKALIIYANYKDNSFTSAIKDYLAESFHKNGHEVVIRDLYEIKFNPVLSKNDLESIEKEIFPIDIMNEQKFIQWADLICFVYPIWWSGMPAILKGYIERVFVMGYAFTFEGNNVIPKLKDKQVAIFNTIGSKDVYKEQNRLDALNTITKDCIFEFCGMKIVHHEYFNSIPNINEKDKQSLLDKISKTASEIL